VGTANVSKQNPTSNYSIGADLIRILGGLGVVFIHVSDSFILFPDYHGGLSWWIIFFLNTITKVCVPLFVMISGYLLLDIEKSYEANTFFRKRVLRVGIPFVFWTILFFIWQAVWVHKTITLPYFIDSILRSNLGYLYFMVIIFEIYLIAPVIRAYVGNATKKNQAYLLIGSFLLTALVLAINRFYPPAEVNWGGNILTRFIPYTPYFIAGAFLRSVSLSIKHTYILYALFWILGILATTAGSDIKVEDLDGYSRHFSSPFIIVMTLIAFVSLITIGNRINTQALSSRLVQFVRNASVSIFGIYLVQLYVIDILDYFFNLQPGHIVSPIWLYIVFKALIVFVISYIIVQLLSRLSFTKIIFGQV